MQGGILEPRGSRRRSHWVLALAAAGVAGLVSSCLAHRNRCYSRCMDQHNACVAMARNDVELKVCDDRLAQCRRSCP